MTENSTTERTRNCSLSSQRRSQNHQKPRQHLELYGLPSTLWQQLES